VHQRDTADQWVRAGQALQRVLLIATVHGLAATPMSQPLEIPTLRELITDTGTRRWAQVILRVGYGQSAAATPRRPLTEVLMPPSDASSTRAAASGVMVSPSTGLSFIPASRCT
jgi:hypothetical protein